MNVKHKGYIPLIILAAVLILLLLVFFGIRITEIMEPVNTPAQPMRNSLLVANVIDESTGLPVSGEVSFLIRIEYSPPYENRSLNYTTHLYGISPYSFYVGVPPVPSEARIMARKDGFSDSAELVIDDDFFWSRVSSPATAHFQPDDSGILLEHNFTIAPEPAPVVKTCAGDADCGAGFSCWAELPRGPFAGIRGSRENPGTCLDNSILSEIA